MPTIANPDTATLGALAYALLAPHADRLWSDMVTTFAEHRDPDALGVSYDSDPVQQDWAEDLIEFLESEFHWPHDDFILPLTESIHWEADVLNKLPADWEWADRQLQAAIEDELEGYRDCAANATSDAGLARE